MYHFDFPESGFQTFTMVRQAWIAMNKVCERELAKLGLTPEIATVLWICRDYPGTLIPAELSRIMFRENQTIAGLLNRMEQQGFIKRIPKRKGKPYTDIKLTPKGEKACGPAAEKYKAAIDDLTADLSPEQHKQFQKSMQALRDKALGKLHLELSQVAEKYIPLKL
jgi:DNA-binding MarR family transcriptional regulator